jgi:hypothetical protein
MPRLQAGQFKKVIFMTEIESAGRPRMPIGFSASDLKWAVYGWAKVAPGFGGWKVVVEVEANKKVVHVFPPSPLPDPTSGPRFTITPTTDGKVLLFRQLLGAAREALHAFPNLADALHALCALTPSQETHADELAAAATEDR